MRKLIKRSFNIYMRKRRRALRLEVITAYGGKCTCCGETEWMFLAVDHINGLQGESRADLYARLKRAGFPKENYQVICHNCNLAKGFYGRCPHQGPEPEPEYVTRTEQRTLKAEVATPKTPEEQLEEVRRLVGDVVEWEE